MLMQYATSGEGFCRAQLTTRNDTVIITEQVGKNHWETVDIYLPLTPTLAKELDFCLSVYRQELEHGQVDTPTNPPT